MLNVRKLKQDFSQSVLREGKQLFEENKVMAAKILNLDPSSIRISAKIGGQFETTYESVIEVDRSECDTIDSDCDCPYHYDCQHLAALLFYLEAHLDDMLVKYSKETGLKELDKKEQFDEEQKTELIEAVQEAVTKQEMRKDQQYQKELMDEYVTTSKILANSPFFYPVSKKSVDQAELAIVFFLPEMAPNVRPIVELQLALRLPSRSKPLHIPFAKDFIEGIRHEEFVVIGGKQYLFSLESFRTEHREIARMLIDYARVHDRPTTERSQRSAYVEMKAFGLMLGQSYEVAMRRISEQRLTFPAGDFPVLPCVYQESLETPMAFSPSKAQFNIDLERIDPPISKILVNPQVLLDEKKAMLEDVRFFECAFPGCIHENTYYRFHDNITRQHLMQVGELREMTVPEPLFGSFVEYSLGELSRYACLANPEQIHQFTTIPYAQELTATCQISYVDGELEATIAFQYEDFEIPAVPDLLTHSDIAAFIKPEGVLARNLVEERKIIEEIFNGFVFEEATGAYVAKTEKKIIEFMTAIIPANQHRITFHCPQNLLDQFIYDESTFSLSLSHTQRVDMYEIEIKVEGGLSGIRISRLWECILARRSYLELESKKTKQRNRGKGTNKIPKILIIDLEKTAQIVQLFDEMGIEKLENHKLQYPIWSLANIDAEQFKGLPVTFQITKKLMEIRKQMLGETKLEFSPIPATIHGTLRPYQIEGIQWLERIRMMYLNCILADDMGLGKTFQAIVALAQSKNEQCSMVVCPTSLLYNWKEEISKFCPSFKCLIVDGIPNQRRKLISTRENYDIIITSYSLLQKDIAHYKEEMFNYVILDEAQHIKNRGTRNAKSVKMLQAQHKLILSGTPIENSLDELWSLFDFLMPNFLGTYDRFMEKYIRIQGQEQTKNLEYLRKKVAPFILRRTKGDVLDDLPPVSELIYHCQLTDIQSELYKSYAASARNELVKLVERDGFDKVQIHVLATLTRLKQICCHPAIFAKENPEPGDCAKYEMLLDLLQTLIEGNHKTVIFSQYTKMLRIMRNDFEKQGIKLLYLDGASKNRLEIVNQFNEDPTISVFLVSLKAGGTGLNLVGADTVVHYDMWWNPAVENQATDRVHRIGQKQNVSVYKLITLNTIEEKIVEMQQRKEGIVKKVVSTDDEVMSKLTWEDVLELLQT